MNKRGLGKGLSDLGVEALLMSDSDSAVEVVKSDEGLRYLAVNLLQPGRYQPRQQIDAESLQELADSIRAQGIIQPIIVRQIAGSYEIIAGERRWRAAQLVGLQEVPVVIRELEDQTALAMSLIENIQRRDLNVIEEATALQRLLQEFGMTHQDIAAAIDKSRSTVTNLLRLLNLNPDVRELVAQGQLDMGHARALLALEGDQQSAVANNIVVRQLSVREAEQLVQRVQKSQPVKVISPVDFSELENSLRDRTGFDVKIKENSRGKGRLVVSYKNAKQRDAVLKYFDKK